MLTELQLEKLFYQETSFKDNESSVLSKNFLSDLSKEQITKINSILADNVLTSIHLEEERIHNIRYINKHFKKVNQALRIGDVYIGRVRTLDDWKKQRKARHIPFIGFFVRASDFLFLRVMPKMNGFKQLYFRITKGKGRIISKAEVLGRLVSCGFEILHVQSLDGEHLFVAKKSGKPLEKTPSYGPLFKMERVGKGGKIIGVYKLRTMHPYSEFLQEYLIKHHGYAPNGKLNDDYRTTVWSRRLRKYWIDEIPQLLNVLKGDMKLVGVRPVSKIYFDQLPIDLQEKRKRFKPGCIPPYVAFNRESSLKSVLDCELEYLNMKDRRPYTTDTVLFFRAVFNIVFRGKRSA